MAGVDGTEFSVGAFEQLPTKTKSLALSFSITMTYGYVQRWKIGRWNWGAI